MKLGVEKKNNPELIVDWNGNAVQAWVMGGRTINVSGSFVCESSLMRVCNTGSEVARIKLKNADFAKLYNGGEDVGMPILPNTSVILGNLNNGAEYEVEGTLDVTFFYDRRVRLTTDEEKFPEFKASTLEKLPVAEEEYVIEGTLAKVSGLIPFAFEDRAIGRSAGNRVGIQIRPNVDINAYKDVVVEFNNFADPNPDKVYYSADGLFTELPDKTKVIQYWPLIKEPDQMVYIRIKWDRNTEEVFAIYIDSKATLQMG